MNDIWNISCENACSEMPQGLIDDKSTLVQVMAWCHQATSLYQNQWWPRYIWCHMASIGNNQLNHWAYILWGPNFHTILHTVPYIDGLIQERRNSIANPLELHLSWTNPSIWSWLINRHGVQMPYAVSGPTSVHQLICDAATRCSNWSVRQHCRLDP